MNKIRKGDEVIVLAGRDKGKRGKVTLRADDSHLVIDGINLVKKHTKPNPRLANTITSTRPARPAAATTGSASQSKRGRSSGSNRLICWLTHRSSMRHRWPAGIAPGAPPNAIREWHRTRQPWPDRQPAPADRGSAPARQRWRPYRIPNRQANAIPKRNRIDGRNYRVCAAVPGPGAQAFAGGAPHRPRPVPARTLRCVAT